MPALAKNNRLANAALAALGGHILPKKAAVSKIRKRAAAKVSVEKAAAEQPEILASEDSGDVDPAETSSSQELIYEGEKSVKLDAATTSVHPCKGQCQVVCITIL